ncbi:MAG: phosphoribosylglycinamide formyltransferase [Alteromonadaceae bacterium]|nr:phosphoribosylglycinamide formyltransferase [Alteromonadaceae bacterium]
MNRKPRIVVLISGSGSNLQAIMDACASEQIEGSVVGVISNKADAYGLTRAGNAGIETKTLSHKAFSSREEFDAQLAEEVDAFDPDYIVLAGFMRILTDQFVQRYLGKMVNIHPSLLPKYKGLHTHQRAIDAGDSTHGASVHFVTPALDDGPVLVQGAVSIDADDDADSLQHKVHKIEHIIYPVAMQWLCSGKVKMANGRVYLNNELLPIEGKMYDVN